MPRWPSWLLCGLLLSACNAIPITVPDHLDGPGAFGRDMGGADAGAVDGAWNLGFDGPQGFADATADAVPVPALDGLGIDGPGDGGPNTDGLDLSPSDAAHDGTDLCADDATSRD